LQEKVQATKRQERRERAFSEQIIFSGQERRERAFSEKAPSTRTSKSEAKRADSGARSQPVQGVTDLLPRGDSQRSSMSASEDVGVEMDTRKSHIPAWVRCSIGSIGEDRWQLSKAAPPWWQRGLSRIGLWATEREILAVKEEVKHKPLFRMVHSFGFKLMTFLLLLLYAFFVGAYVEFRLRGRGLLDGYWQGIDVAFLLAFSLDLALRLVASPFLFFFLRDGKYNVLEGVSCVFHVAHVMIDTRSQLRALVLLSTLRLIRFAAMFGIFPSCRLAMLGILASIQSMYWAFLVIGGIVYACSLFIVNMIVTSNPEGFEPGGRLADLYGGVYASMVTLFMTITGGIDWHEAWDVLIQVHVFFEPGFIAFIFFMYFAVVNVVVGAVVAAIADVVKNDKEALVSGELALVYQHATKLEAIFREADKMDTGMLEWAVFQAHLSKGDVKAYLRALELDVPQVLALYHILDVDGSHRVDLYELVNSCMSLRSQAKSLDIKLLMCQTERSYVKLKETLESVHKRLMGLERRMERSTVGSSRRPEPSFESNTGVPILPRTGDADMVSRETGYTTNQGDDEDLQVVFSELPHALPVTSTSYTALEASYTALEVDLEEESQMALNRPRDPLDGTLR